MRGYREDRSWKNLALGAALALGVSLLFAALLIALARLVARLRNRLIALLRTRPQGLRFHSTQLLTTRQIVNALLTAVLAGRWLVVLFLLQIYIPLVLGFFPGTVRLANTLTGWIWSPFRFLGASLIAYLPNLLYVVVIVIAVYYAIRLSDFAFREIAAGRIRLEGFHVDWAEPTSKLARIVILAAGLVAVFPYLPGSESPAFKSISIFFGVLFSLGSTSAVANMVAGIIITYMRPFQIGDRVKISETTGDVLEKNLLVTRIRTIKNVVVTIPNGNVLGAQILNYTAPAREKVLILHSSVTIGYDTPWRKVHELLINAARNTEHILEEPKPFVLQTALNDFYVSYEINAYTAEASRMVAIYSQLHQNIQDQFNEAGMEIMSPHYTSVREGNTIAIPEPYRPKDYYPPRFRVDALGRGE
ncbi:MAG: mechanosensitive ion channel family protein [Bryobacteraceae bacterium]